MILWEGLLFPRWGSISWERKKSSVKFKSLWRFLFPKLNSVIFVRNSFWHFRKTLVWNNASNLTLWGRGLPKEVFLLWKSTGNNDFSYFMLSFFFRIFIHLHYFSIFWLPWGIFNSVLLYLSARNLVQLGSVLEHTWGILKPSGHSLWHLPLSGPAWSGGLNKMTSKGPFLYQPFCDCDVPQKFLNL